MNAQNKSTEQITAKVWQIVNSLPHRSVIAESDARVWVEEVVHLHGEAAIWHAIRLNGFGGSEIGVLVRNRGGVRADHQASAHDIVAGKLMRKAPTESSGHMTRGHENEEPHSKRFYVKYRASRDIEAYEALKAAQGKRPWMRYSPDDVVQMPVSLSAGLDGIYHPTLNVGANRRWLIDYKAPSKIEQNDEVAFQYACQLTQGAILCAESGIELDGMMLSQFDWANWLLKDDAILWDQSLGQLVIDAGDFYWQSVLRGEVPDFIRTVELSGVDDYKKSYATAAEMYANLSAMAGAAKDRADEIRKLILEPVAGKKLNGQKITFSNMGDTLVMSAKRLLDRDLVVKALTEDQLLSVSKKTAFDATAMAAALKDLDVDIAPFRTYELDSVKVYAKASEMGLDPDVLISEQFVMAPSKAIKAQMFEYIDQNYPLEGALVLREQPVAAVLQDGQRGEEGEQAVPDDVQQLQGSQVLAPAG